MKTLSDKAMLVTLTLGVFAPKRTDKQVTTATNAAHGTDSRAGKYVKNLMPEESVERLKKLCSEVRQYHYTNTLPWFNDGTNILPARRYMEYMAQMREFKSRWQTEVDVFVGEYDNYVAKAKEILNGMFNESDYPPSVDVRQKFKFNMHVLPLPSVDDFRVGLVQEEIMELQAELQVKLDNAQKQAQQALKERLAAPLNAMVERLSNVDNVFRDSLVGNLKEIVEVVPALDMESDVLLQELTRQAGELVVEPVRLREDVTLRLATAKRAQELLDKLQSYGG